MPEIIKKLNSSVTRLTGEEPIKAYKENFVDEKIKKYNRPVGFDEKRIYGNILVRYLLEKGEEEGGNVRRATDPIWSSKVYSLKKAQITKDQPVFYFLEDEKIKRGFVREEIQIIPFDTVLPPNFFLK